MPTRRYEIPSYWRNWKVNDGIYLMGYIEPLSIDPDFWVKSLYSKWDPDPVNVAYLDRFLAFAAEHKITVYWLLPPLHPDVQCRTDAREPIRPRVPDLRQGHAGPVPGDDRGRLEALGLHSRPVPRRGLMVELREVP